MFIAIRQPTQAPYLLRTITIAISNLPITAQSASLTPSALRVLYAILWLARTLPPTTPLWHLQKLQLEVWKMRLRVRGSRGLVSPLRAWVLSFQIVVYQCNIGDARPWRYGYSLKGEWTRAMRYGISPVHSGFSCMRGGSFSNGIRLALCSILVERRNICPMHFLLIQWWLKNYGVAEYKSNDQPT